MYMCTYAYVYKAAHRGQKREPVWGDTAFGFWEPSESSQQRQSIFLTADPFSSLHLRFYNTHEVFPIISVCLIYDYAMNRCVKNPVFFSLSKCLVFSFVL